MKSISALVTIAVLLLPTSSVALAQDNQKLDRFVAALDAPSRLHDHDFAISHFDLIRLKYRSSRPFQSDRAWRVDFPRSDESLATIFSSLTGLKVGVRALEITDPELIKNPFALVVEPALMSLSEKETARLRIYCKAGGTLLFDDSWGEDDNGQIQSLIRDIFPNQELVELPIDHEIFHNVFELASKPQIPSEKVGLQGLKRLLIGPAQFRGIVGENERIILLWCHNTDLADGWSGWQSDDKDYSEKVSQRSAVPMGVNILFYTLNSSARRHANE